MARSKKLKLLFKQTTPVTRLVNNALSSLKSTSWEVWIRIVCKRDYKHNKAVKATSEFMSFPVQHDVSSNFCSPI